MVGAKAEPEEYDLEYRALEDDAWYIVHVAFDANGGKLSVKYWCTPKEHEAVFSAADFTTEAQVDELAGRFRPVSKPVKHHQCGMLSIGTTVCASGDTFDGIDWTKKKDLLSKAGVMHKNFRSRLRKLAYNEDTGLYSAIPPEDYKDCPMVAPYWRDFVIQSKSDDFKKLSKRNREQAKGMNARYRGASKGLARIREDLKEEKKKVGCSSPTVTRVEIFEASRKTRDGNIPDPNARRIIEEAGRISKTMTPDKAYTIGPDDVLARAIGRQEHPGRLRSTGHGITVQSLMAARANEKTRTCIQKLEKQVADLARQVAQLQSGQRQFSPGMSSGASCEY